VIRQFTYLLLTHFNMFSESVPRGVYRVERNTDKDRCLVVEHDYGVVRTYIYPVNHAVEAFRGTL
jgi:hypothetical protein